MNTDKLREEFEAWFEPNEDNRRSLKAWRTEDGYRGDAWYLSGCWQGYQAASASRMELERDAMRYRWLRSNGYEHADNELPYVSRHEMNDWGKWLNYVIEEDELDAAIDAVLSKEQQ